KAAVDAKRLAPANMPAARRDRMVLLFIVSSQETGSGRFSFPAARGKIYRISGNAQGKFSKYLLRLRRGRKASRFRRLAAALAPDELGGDAHLLAVAAAGKALQQQVHRRLAD